MPGFDEVRKVAEVFSAYSRPWFIAGGWASDLFLGRVTREHEDVDVAVLRPHQLALREHLRRWDVRYADPNVRGVRLPWPAGQWLTLPVHELHAGRPSGDPAHVEVLLNEAVGPDWLYRRDPRVRLPLVRLALTSPDGIPFLAPEVVLLYKSKNPGPTDEQDFRACLPHLGPERAGWLVRALDLCDPEHGWLGVLRTAVRLPPPGIGL